MTTVAEAVTFLRKLAPLALAEEWDNVGLLVGDTGADLRGVMTCLTLTPDIADEAIARGAGLIVAHHPVLFRPVQRLTTDTPEGRMLLRLISERVAVYSAHTAYDSAQDGINQQLAELFGLRNTSFLRAKPFGEVVKIVTFVPEADLEKVQRAQWDAGAGHIGAYSECSFYMPGTGTFHGSQETNPAVGRAGQFERVSEIKLETICPAEYVEKVMEAIKDAHPYEEPAVDVIPLKLLPATTGSGRYGDLPAPLSLAEFNAYVKQRLRIGHLQFVGEASARIERVGIACGSAAEFLRDARRLGCQALVTGEARFHACLEAREAGIALVLAGHYATERPAMERLAELLTSEFPSVPVWASETERDPLEWA